MSFEYVAGAELPAAAITWTDADGDVIDFSTGWTFTVMVGRPGREALVTKTTGIVGSATAPNITISWAADDLNVKPTTYDLQITATNGSGLDRRRTIPIKIAPAVQVAS